MRTTRRQSGFTMLELTTVGLIIMTMVVIALPNFLEAQIRAKVTSEQAELSLVATALEEYYINYRKYPPNVAPKTAEGGIEGDGDPASRGAALLVLTTPVSYLSSLPVDPFAGSGIPADSWFDYVNFVDLSGTTAPRAGFAMEGHAAYTVVGLAPDGIPNMVAETFPPYGIQYSPTNGTKSDGDMLILGP